MSSSLVHLKMIIH